MLQQTYKILKKNKPQKQDSPRISILSGGQNRHRGFTANAKLNMEGEGENIMDDDNDPNSIAESNALNSIACKPSINKSNTKGSS